MLTVTAPETMNTDVLDIMGEIFARFVTRELKKNRPGAARRLIRYVQRDMQPNALRVASQRARLLLRTEPALPRVQHVDF